MAAKRRENVRLKRKAEEDRRVGLFTACRAGFVEEVRIKEKDGILVSRKGVTGLLYGTTHTQ